MPLTDPITDGVVKDFCDNTARPLGDLLSGLLAALDPITNAVRGKDLAALLGTTDDDLFSATPWTDQNYVDRLGYPPVPVVGSDSGGRTLLTNYDLVALIRVVAHFQKDRNDNAALGPLVGKIAVNPRPQNIVSKLGL